MPRFGTEIPTMAFEPLDGETVSTVRGEVTRVINFDPRVELIDIQTNPDYDNNSLYVGASVYYIELDIVDDFELNITFSS